jgi:hypothetical protein
MDAEVNVAAAAAAHRGDDTLLRAMFEELVEAHGDAAPLPHGHDCPRSNEPAPARTRPATVGSGLARLLAGPGGGSGARSLVRMPDPRVVVDVPVPEVQLPCDAGA